jgi:hypothetical protein
VPDETARVTELEYINPRPADWAEADFIIGNPPFIGNSRMRQALGDGYTEALRAAYPEVPESSDLVMYWWHKAAELVRAGKVRRFGFIATNSLRQTFNRRVIEAQMTAKPPLSLIYAVPDHPWMASSESAAVRISMTVGVAGEHSGTLAHVTSESRDAGGSSEGREVEMELREGKVHADLTIGADVAGAKVLRADEKISSLGVSLHGAGFIVTPAEAEQLGLGRTPDLEKHIRHYRNGRDLTTNSRNVMVIDLEGLKVEEVRAKFPEVYQWVLERVKPERDHNNEKSRRELWWLFGRRHTELRLMLKTFRATSPRSKHQSIASSHSSTKSFCLTIGSSQSHTMMLTF